MTMQELFGGKHTTVVSDGEKVRATQVNLSELSRRTGIRTSTISRIFSEGRAPRMEIGLKLAQAMGVDVKEIEKWARDVRAGKYVGLRVKVGRPKKKAA